MPLSLSGLVMSLKVASILGFICFFLHNKQYSLYMASMKSYISAVFIHDSVYDATISLTCSTPVETAISASSDTLFEKKSKSDLLYSYLSRMTGDAALYV